jgi:hypothetical protein
MYIENPPLSAKLRYLKNQSISMCNLKTKFYDKHNPFKITGFKMISRGS